jgi:peptide/nickel transport system permease protein
VQKYLLRRAFFGLGTLIGVSLIVFVVLRVLPGDPLVAMFGMEGFTKLSPGDRARLMADLGLSDPLPVQYVRWLGDIASGSLGKSFFRGEKVSDVILHRGPLSAEIAFLSLVISWLVGLPVGLISAFRPNRLSDNVARSLSILFIAIPGFWLGMLVVLGALFWFGYKAPITVIHLWQDPWKNLQVVIGPAIVLGLGQGAYIARMSRSCLLEVIREDYVRTARAKGLAETAVVVRHALKNALIPIVTVVGLQFGTLLGGAVLTESVFGWPGMGLLLVDSIFSRDYAMVQGIVLVFSGLFILVNLVVDLLYALVDPRIQYG